MRVARIILAVRREHLNQSIIVQYNITKIDPDHCFSLHESSGSTLLVNQGDETRCRNHVYFSKVQLLIDFIEDRRNITSPWCYPI